jgi:coenzyme F420-reducing hydrogenase alpha subunit
MQGANFIVATQHNISAINATIQAAAAQFLSQPDAELLNGVEFAIRCYDPCLSCSTHQLGGMPLDVTIAQNGQVVRSLRR